MAYLLAPKSFMEPASLDQTRVAQLLLASVVGLAKMAQAFSLTGGMGGGVY